MTVEEGIRNFVKENRQYEIYDESTGNGTFHRGCLGVIVRQEDIMPDFFDDRGFNEFYLKSAKSKDKERLLRAFYDAWIDYWGPYNTIRTQTKSWVKGAWKDAKAKKAIKEKLLYRKFTAATIDGLFKKFSEWIKISCK